MWLILQFFIPLFVIGNYPSIRLVTKSMNICINQKFQTTLNEFRVLSFSLQFCLSYLQFQLWNWIAASHTNTYSTDTSSLYRNLFMIFLLDCCCHIQFPVVVVVVDKRNFCFFFFNFLHVCLLFFFLRCIYLFHSDWQFDNIMMINMKESLLFRIHIWREENQPNKQRAAKHQNMYKRKAFVNIKIKRRFRLPV